ncbi:efflux RND transporter periplasmic adaptor subunit [Paludisphaera sp.]|uniref:efflux RND transporter periplasmic adaptor subunit n=1 Tax=Paludisphaera sp. TaxID=2017432 RepID=UPI00301D5EC1
MNRLIAPSAAAVAAIVIIGAAVAVARPEWLPSALHGQIGLAPESAPAEAGLFCKEHGVPEKFCTLCHEELKEKLLLCAEHGGIPEDICTLCHPEVKDGLKIVVCEEHGLPESFCAQCGRGPSASSDALDDGWCATHNKPESFCLECQLDPEAHLSPGAKVCLEPLPIVRLASAELSRQVGIETALATEVTHAHKLTFNAETAYDANHYAEIAPRVVGFLHDVRVDLGRVVKQGEVLAVVDSAEVSSAKAQLITARASLDLAQVTYERTKSLSQTGAIAVKSELEARTALNQAKASSLDAEQKLRNFGFDDERLSRIVEDQDTKSLLDVVAPLDGQVVMRHAVKGEPVQATDPIFAVTDTSTLWLWIDVYESDLAALKPGQPVTLTVSGGDDETFSGRLNWIGTEVNQQTRTTRVRAELENRGEKLRANQFGQAEIQLGDEHKAVVVPKLAVQRKDNVDVVFLPQEEGGVYRPQRVTTKPADKRDALEVTWGLKAGQRVVTKGAFLLKTEIMKGAIGAGCCE